MTTSCDVMQSHVIFRLSKKDKLGNRLSSHRKKAAQAGLEPTACHLLSRCSTTELPRQLSWLGRVKAIQRALESLSPDKQNELLLGIHYRGHDLLFY